jgi:hypothetical protein
VIQPPVQAVWRDGDKLVVGRGAVLPPLCVKCGQPSSGRPLKKTFYWHSPWLYLLILPGLLIYFIVALALRKRFDLALPLCEAHRSRRTTMLWIGGLLSLCVVIFPIIGAAIGKDDLVGPLVGFGFLFLLVGLIVLSIGSATIRPNRIDDDRAEFKGAGRDFLNQFATGQSLGIR